MVIKIGSEPKLENLSKVRKEPKADEWPEIEN